MAQEKLVRLRSQDKNTPAPKSPLQGKIDRLKAGILLIDARIRTTNERDKHIIFTLRKKRRAYEEQITRLEKIAKILKNILKCCKKKGEAQGKKEVPQRITIRPLQKKFFVSAPVFIAPHSPIPIAVVLRKQTLLNRVF